MAVHPSGDGLLVAALSDEEVKDLGFAAGVGGHPKVGLVVDRGPDCQLSYGIGDRVYFHQEGAKVGPTTGVICERAVIAFDPASER